jgi:hypothetical protein
MTFEQFVKAIDGKTTGAVRTSIGLSKCKGSAIEIAQ